jgi:hypothetical protein
MSCTVEARFHAFQLNRPACDGSDSQVTGWVRLTELSLPVESVSSSNKGTGNKYQQESFVTAPYKFLY